MAGRPLDTADSAPGLADLRSARQRFARWNLGFDRYIAYVLPLLFLVAILPILDLVYWVSSKALPTLTLAKLTTTSASLSLYPAILGTLYIMLIATAIAVALGLFGGIATAEFLSERAAGWVRLTANTLAGTPAIIIGMMAFIVFAVYLNWSLVLITGAVATGIFMVPYVFRASDLAFSAVPRHLREAALGAGARPLDYIVRVARPIATPQILNGVLFAFSLGVGEAATIVILVSYSPYPPQGLFEPAGTLVGIIAANYQSPLPDAVTQAFQAAFILLIVVVALNVIIRVISWRYQKRLAGVFV